MRESLETITYIATGVASLTVLNALRKYLYALPLYMIVGVCFFLIVLIIFYLYYISSKDVFWKIKFGGIMLILFVMAIALFSSLKMMVLSFLISAVVSLGAYYNYYRITEHVCEKGMKIMGGENEYYMRGINIESLDKYILSHNGNIYDALNSVLKEIEQGRARLFWDEENTYLVEVRK